MAADLQALVHKWRDEARDIRYGEGSHRSCKCEELEACADELETELAALRAEAGAVGYSADDVSHLVACARLATSYTGVMCCDDDEVCALRSALEPFA